MDDIADVLPERVLFRIVKRDDKGRIFGTPSNPRPPTLPEFNPRLVEIAAGDLEGMIVVRKHGILPDQEETIRQLDDVELIRFRPEDPISATEMENGWSLTGGHHRTNEIAQRVRNGQLAGDVEIKVLLHD